MDAFWSFRPPIEPFSFFSPIHLIALAAIALFSVVAVVILGKKKNARLDRGFELVAAFLLIADYIVYIVWMASFEEFNWAYHLPLHLCDTALIILIVQLLLLKKNQILYEIIYFVGLGGAVQALLTPIVGRYGFPHFLCLTFFFQHGFLVAIPLYLTIVRGMRINLKSLIRFFLITNAFLAFVVFVNWFIQFLPPSYERGDYMFLTYPPVTGSVIDVLVRLFGPSPGYIVGLELFGLAICILLYLPFPIRKRWAAKRSIRRDD